MVSNREAKPDTLVDMRGGTEMKTLRRLLVLSAAILVVVYVAQAAELQGILIDKMCSAKVLQGGQKAARAHTRECALMPDCAKSGYGVYTADGKFITFDSDGNKKAEEALRASKKKDNLRVTVTGELSGDTITLASLKLL